MPAADGGGRPVVIIGGPPTTNGDLHIGHVAGPYLAADVHARYLRAIGQDVVYASGGDDSQSYVVTSAARLGTTPRELTVRCWDLIRGTFEAMGIGLDGFAPTDDGYRASVYAYVNRLYELGAFRMRTVRLPYSERTGTFLVEGHVGGDCPTCLADSRGAVCETCGHWIDFDALRNPYSILDRTDVVSYRQADIMVFPLEEYRQRLVEFHQSKAATWRPHLVSLMRELLAAPLPDFAVTYPVDWGLPAPFPQTPGQTLNAWLEGMPASMYCTAYARGQLGRTPPAADDPWRAGHGTRLLFFVGFDNLFIWALVHVAELIAHQGRYVLPETILTNEFYDLEHEKFSTSKGHVVWARELVAEVPRDIVRFYLTLTAPEHARTNFSRAALDKVAGQRLVGPWNELAAALAKLTAEVGDATLPTSVPGRELAAAMTARFRHCYDLDSFSLSRAADLVVQHVDRLRVAAGRLLGAAGDRDGLPAGLGDLFLQLRALIGCASPILVDLAGRAALAGDVTPSLAAGTAWPAGTTAFAVPALDLRTAPAGDPAPAPGPTRTV